MDCETSSSRFRNQVAVSHRVGKLGLRNRVAHTVIPFVWGGGNLDPHLSAKMRKMNEYQRIFADKLMNDVLFKGLLKQLTPSTQILNNSPQPLVTISATVLSRSTMQPTKLVLFIFFSTTL
jgi:hypothetical protein